MKYLCLLIVTLLSLAPLTGQEISGFVLEKDSHTPIAYATITLQPQGENTVIKGEISDEQGHFSIPIDELRDMELHVSCVGYDAVTMPISGRDSLSIYLSPATGLLGEVVVRGERPQIRLSGGTLQVGVQGTVLARATRLIDLLSRVPGLISRDGSSVQTVGGISPSFYLNGRRITNLAELERIDVKRIRTVSLDTHPGAKYGSDEQAVVLIETLNALEGLSVRFASWERWNHRFSHDNGIDAGYKSGRWMILGGVNYSDYRKKSLQLIETRIKEEQGEHKIDTRLEDGAFSNKDLTYHVGVEHQTSDRFQWGARYNGSVEGFNTAGIDSTEAILASGITERLQAMSHLSERNHSHHVNLFAMTQLSDSWSARIFSDYFYKREGRDQEVEEQSSLSNGSTLHKSRIGARYHFLSLKPVFEWQVADHHTIEFGGDASYIDSRSNQQQDGSTRSDVNSTEQSYALFASYTTTLGGIGVRGGLRYEYVDRALTDRVDSNGSLHKAGGNLLGSLSLSTNWGKTAHSLSYRSQVNRPPFSSLNSNTYYSSKYTRQRGNPTLVPSVEHSVQYTFYYDFLYLAASYAYEKDHIAGYFAPLTGQPGAYIFTWRNYEHSQDVELTLNLQKKFGFYHPNLTYAFVYSRIKGDLDLTTQPVPLHYIAFDNDFDLPWGIKLNAEYKFYSTSTHDLFIFRPRHTVGLQISKSFCDDRLDVAIAGRDILRGDIVRYGGGIGNIHFRQVEDQDRRCVSLSLTWRFNQYKDSYRGESDDKTLNRF